MAGIACFNLVVSQLLTSTCLGQQPWQPARMPQANSAKPLNTASYSDRGNQPASSSAGQSSAQSDQVRLGASEGVVLRWKSPAEHRGAAGKSTVATHHTSAGTTHTEPDRVSARIAFETTPPAQPSRFADRHVEDATPRHWQATRPTQPEIKNPLRRTMATSKTATRAEQARQPIRRAAYQQLDDPFETVPQLQPAQPTVSPDQVRYGDAFADSTTAFDPPEEIPYQEKAELSPPDSNGLEFLPPDVLDRPEDAPAPQNVLQDSTRSPFQDDPQFSQTEPAPTPSNETSPSVLEPSVLEPSASDRTPSMQESQFQNDASELESRPAFPSSPEVDDSRLDGQLPLPDRSEQTRSLSCEERRNLLKNNPISNVSLDVSPTFGEGLRGVRQENEQKRLEFAARSEERSWHSSDGELLAVGRMINLKHDNVVLDVAGQVRVLPIRELSDVDAAYVGNAWGIPLRCGYGDFDYDGRNYMHSIAQWKAPGHCHKPLYFEQPQLERYGHELGPVLQPLVSSAHFFANIAVLPYKAGIHPPYECQYPLGYYRPGDCTPYMVRPIPWSLKGAAVQAGVIGAAIPLLP